MSKCCLVAVPKRQLQIPIPGLHHGLIFAGALTQVGLPEGERLLDPFAFFIEIERGQFTFVSHWRCSESLSWRGVIAVARASITCPRFRARSAPYVPT